VFRRGEGLIGSRGVTPAHLPILSLLATLILVSSLSAVPILSLLAALILVLSISAILIWVLSLVLFIWIVLVWVDLVVLGGIVNNHRLYCKFFVSFSGLAKLLIIRGEVSGFSGKTLL
jgi:hypothetical protein